MSIDYLRLGLKIGLEVHQQLNTKEKLFCACKPELFKEEPEITFLRQLRPTQSELGQVDPAAFFEFQKGVKILYEANQETSCLVEMDEEPPHNLNPEAAEIALTVALMTNCRPADEIHVMRKTVIDGSNTTGFQRTCIIALNGSIDIEGKPVQIQLIALEEDAARKTREEQGSRILRYRIDRLCIPLIEVTTAPVLHTPSEAEKVALAIGRVLRATGKVKRGLGTIRQDLNVSIPNGALTEVKGVQELEQVSRVIEYEVQRQLNLLKIRDELKKRGANESDLKEEFKDISTIFNETKSKLIRKSLDEGKKVLAVKLPNFADMLGTELIPNLRLGTEMAARARFWGRVGGLFHTDELPAYGITDVEVTKIKELTGADEKDAVVLVADTFENANDALRAVVERAKEALKGVPEETRNANPDSTTQFMRPRPGAARMYPETDVPPLQLGDDYLKTLRSKLPELPEHKMARFVKEYGLNQKLIRQVLDSEYTQLFETIAKQTKVSPTIIAAALTETLKSLEREGIGIENLSDGQILGLFNLIDAGKTTKEAIPDLVSWLTKHEGASATEAVQKVGLQMLTDDEIEKIIAELLKENKSLIEKSGKENFSILMGLAMKKLRGKANPEKVSQILKKKMG